MSVSGIRATLWRRRWWLVALALVIAVRALLPVVLRRVIVSQASQALNAQVGIGDVDLELWRGGVALEDVAVRPAGSAPAADITATDATAEPPIVAFKRLAVGVHYWPLFSHTVQLREITLDNPRLAVDRLASGDLNLNALVPKSEVAVAAGATPGAADAATPTAAASAAESPPTPWRYGLDRFVLRDGRLRFRDLKLEGSEPVEVGIDQVTVDEVALSPGVYGEPAQAHVKLGVDEGTIDVTSQLRVLDKGFAVGCHVQADRLPLRRARLYVPKVGWSDLKGELDLAIDYDLQTETEPRNALSGTLALRNVAVAVPQIEDVAMSWNLLAVDIETIDLQNQRAAVRDVSLGGARLYVRARGDQPLLAQLAPDTPTAGADSDATPSASPSPSPSPAPEAESAPPAEPVKPWDWSLATLAITDSTVLILSEQPTVEVGLTLSARDFASAPDAIAHVALGLALADAGVQLDGDVRITPPAFGGTLRIADLALPPLLAVSGAADPALLPSAVVAADLTIAAGLPAAAGATAAPDLLAVNGTLGLRDVRVVPPGEPPLSVDVHALDLSLSDVAVPGVIPIGHKAGGDAALHFGAQLTIQGARVERGGDQPLSVAVESLDLGLSDASVPAALAGLAPFEASQPIAVKATLEIAKPQVTLPGNVAIDADGVALAVKQVTVTAVAPEGSAGQVPPAQLVADLTLRAPHVAIAGGQQLDAGAQSIALTVSELSVPGVAVGAPPVDTGQPLRAAGSLTVAGARAVRGDGKEFSVAAKSIAIPLTELAASGLIAPAAAPGPLRAALGDVRIDAPAIRITRTKDGMVLPGPGAASPASSTAQAPVPPPAPPAAAAPAGRSQSPQITIASLRVGKGKVEFTDRAVKPPFTTRLEPIEIEARDVRLPDASVKPVRIDITNADQGRIILTGEISPQSGELQLNVDDWALPPYGGYATTYSPYSLTDGALEIKTTAKFRGGKYEVENALTLHQLDLGGAEGDSVFEQQFGIPLSMALALLRDASGDITLNIPVQVDQSGGTTVDTVGVVRTALRQALMGAVQSPLKLVGGVLGVGGGGAVAPAPIAFRVGVAEPTGAGSESIGRLAQFLASRPAMGVQLATAPTQDDLRWLREQALRAEFQDESFLQRSIGFLTARGPRERIGSYLTARGDGSNAELSAEDAALLQQWLDERPPPPADALPKLAAARLAAVDTGLGEKGIDAARIAHGAAESDLAEGAPVVRINFRPLTALTQAQNPSPNQAEEGQ